MKTLKKYLISFGISFFFAFLLALLKDIFAQTSPKVIFQILSDSFFAIGVVVAGIGLLVFASNEGTFDMLIYGVSSFINLFRPNSKKKYDSFYDYRINKSKNKTSLGFLLIVGIVLIIISVIMLLIYKQYN